MKQSTCTVEPCNILAIQTTVRNVRLPGSYQTCACMCRVQGLSHLKGLVAKVLDIMRTRVDANLRAAARARLLDLPTGHAFGREEFADRQAACVKHHTDRLVIR